MIAAKAKELILKPWIKIFPQMSTGKILSCDAGVRVMYPKTYLPGICQLRPNVYRFTGLGSRGLLYHAYLAKQLATALEQGSLDSITREFLH
jgi:glycine/D-amino acid oxidase-like deaminating enzyme